MPPSGCNDLPMLNLPNCELLKSGNASRAYLQTERM
jgi:hypothetical protein